MSDAPRDRPRRWACSCWSIAVTAVLVSLAIYLIACQVSVDRLEAEVARLRRAGESLKVSELVPQIGDDEENAAVVYAQAFSLQPNGISDYLVSRPWTAAEATAAHALVAANQGYFDALEEASRIPKCVFEKNWDDGPALLFPEYPQFREAARALKVRAEVERTSGRFDEAAASCATAFRIAGHVDQTPTIISHLTSIAIQDMAMDELARVLSSGDPSPAACRALYEQLGPRARLESLTAAMKGERAFGLATFDLAQQQGGMATLQGQQGLGSRLMGLYPLVGRPLWNQDKLYYLQVSQRAIDATTKPYGEAVRELAHAEDGQSALPSYSSMMTRILDPAFAHPLWSSYRAVAYARGMQIAVAAKAYKGIHGRYPASLEELARDGWRLPRDPFTGKPYRYLRKGQGIVVWSVGPDMTDNHGTDFNPQVHTKPGASGYDYAFQCAR